MNETLSPLLFWCTKGCRTKILSMLLVGSSICATTNPAAAAEITREQAVETILKILIPATLKGDATAYLTAAPLQAGDVVRPFQDGRAKTIQAPTWFAYIDDEPFAFFTHSTRFVSIDVATGKTTIEVQEWWPMVNGTALFSQTQVDANPGLLVFSTRNFKGQPEVILP
jgi:hypothetical protein